MSFVYFIAPEALLNRPENDCGKVVKIGFTKSHPYSRLKTLQTGSPLPLKVWFYFHGSQDLEAAFHETFAELRVHGEWFMVQDKLEEFIQYLGEEPHVGHLVDDEKLAAAVFDNIFQWHPPHPSINKHWWLRSATPECLAAHFPDEWAEALA